MKKSGFLITLIVFWMGVACIAANVANEFLISNPNSYVIISDKPVKKVSSSNLNVAEVKILSTIKNERNMIILEAKNIGKTILTFILDNKTINIEVNVKKDKTIIKPQSGFEYLLMDIPPEILKIDAPPIIKR